jgi:hypothetical protein
MAPSIQQEFEGADFGDKRLNRRLTQIASKLRESPAESIPTAMGTNMELEATYRFLRHESVSPEQILAPHVAATCERVAKAGPVVVAHDTTQFCFSTPREGLGRGSYASEEGRVFFGHVALAVTLDGTRTPLGVLGAETFTRQDKLKKRNRHTEKKPESQRESTRWWQMMKHVEEQLLAGASVIHVADREADQYLLVARLIEAKYRFVIRVRHDRRIELDDHKGATLKHALAPLKGRFTREVPLTAKAPKPMAARRGHRRTTRTATLSFTTTTVKMCLPSTVVNTRMKLPDSLTVNVVHIVESDAPEGYPPIEWKLMSTEPIETQEDVELIVDAYRTRWVIEEYFKALKTGCAFQSRQLESAKTIFNALAVFLPIAWSLFQLRHLARIESTKPAEEVLTKLQIRMLQLHPDVRLVPEPSIQDACLAVARLGGHIKQNGPPGWQVLGRGFEKLLQVELGAQLALTAQEM